MGLGLALVGALHHITHRFEMRVLLADPKAARSGSILSRAYYNGTQRYPFLSGVDGGGSTPCAVGASFGHLNTYRPVPVSTGGCADGFCPASQLAPTDGVNPPSASYGDWAWTGRAIVASRINLIDNYTVKMSSQWGGGGGPGLVIRPKEGSDRLGKGVTK